MTLSLDIGALEQGYAAGSITPADVVGEVYARIAAQGERPVWISLVPVEDALAKARDLPKGPLYGIPFAVKDNIDVAGLLTTCACPDFAYVAERSASVVKRLEAAGAILIGKTNLDQFATGLSGTRSPYGIPVSPFNPDFISGGSSSGSAVAVATGLVSFALGTDTAGSGRVPAAFNNIVGLKPTKGLIGLRGVVPACRTQDVVSIFALTTADAQRVLSVADGFEPADPFARRRPRPAPDAAASGIRVGVPAQEIEFFGDFDAEAIYAAAVERAEGLGTEIVEIDLSPFTEAARLLYSGPWVAERFAAIREFCEANPGSLHETVRQIVLGARALSAVDAFDGIYRLAELTRAAEAEWLRMDLLLLPTAPTTYRVAEMLADPLSLNSNLGLYTNFVNLMDLTALAVPAGFRPDGLPVGVTLIAQAFEERLVASLGDRLHRSLAEARLGATRTALRDTGPVPEAKSIHQSIEVAVVGAHLTGQPLNWQLDERRARLVRTARTARGYTFYELPNSVPPKPGLVYDGQGPGAIEVEIWCMNEAAFGSFVALIPPPLGIGTVRLADGTSVKCFLCEAHAVRGARDITAFGGWRNWLASGRTD